MYCTPLYATPLRPRPGSLRRARACTQVCKEADITEVATEKEAVKTEYLTMGTNM